MTAARLAVADAVSRAKQRLVLTHVARTAAGEPALPSRFLSEVPTALANQRMAYD